MNLHRRRIARLAVLSIGLAACQQAGPDPALPSAEPTTVAPIADEQPATVVHWPEDHDCRSLVAVLKHGLDSGAISDLDDTPFVLLDNQSLTAGAGRFGRSPATASGTSRDAAGVEARCVLRIGQAAERRSEHRVLDHEQVRSRFQSGTRSEKNPAYEVAKARLRRAEKDAKPQKSSIVKVGDPLLDLVGTLVGGALTGLGQWGAGDQLEEALDTLMATPPSIDHPVYKSYHFERARVRASREAVVPITLTDRRQERSWQTSLKRRELRDLVVITGLDRQDEDYARHRQDSLTEDGLRRWLDEAPTPSLADIAAGLLDRPSSSPVDRLALVGLDAPRGAAPSLAGSRPLASTEGFDQRLSLDAAALPEPGLLPKSSLLDDDQKDVFRAPGRGNAPDGRIRLLSENTAAEGVFIAPHMILTASEVIGERGLVDIEGDPGRLALGLVAAVDHGLGLALIQSPLSGKPVIVDAGFAGPSSRAAVTTPGRGVSAPIMASGRLIGFSTASGPDIKSDAILTFIDRQRNLLPINR